jgi:hypothetical protein
MRINKIIKPSRLSEFAVIPTAIFKQKDLSMGAVGLYCWLFSQPPQEEITNDAVLSHFKIGLTAFYSRVKELIKAGFLVRENARNEGKFSGVNYFLSELPHSDLPRVEKPRADDLPEKNVEGIYYNYIDEICNGNEICNDISNEICNDNEICNNNIYNNNIFNKTNNIPRNQKNDYSDGVKKSFDHFAALFPERYQPKNKSQIKKWMDCLDKIERIDKYDLRDVYKMAQRLRNDSFWQNNFLSILKLRNNDKNGVKYIHRFMGQKVDATKTAKSKINGLVKFYKYTTPNGDVCLGAKTMSGEIDQNILAQKLSPTEIEEVIKSL